MTHISYSMDISVNVCMYIYLPNVIAQISEFSGEVALLQGEQGGVVDEHMAYVLRRHLQILHIRYSLFVC